MWLLSDVFANIYPLQMPIFLQALENFKFQIRLFFAPNNEIDTSLCHMKSKYSSMQMVAVYLNLDNLECDFPTRVYCHNQRTAT